MGEVRISGRNPGHVSDLCEELRSEGVNAIDCGSDYPSACDGADVIVTAISGQVPLLKPEWVGPGALYCHVGGWEDEFGVAEKADKIICDDWSSLKHRGSPTIAKMFEGGFLKDEDIHANLGEVLTGKLPGRESDAEFIYFNAIGLGFVDLAVAGWLLERCAERGLGRQFDFSL
jgi:ornithine cyclodeaminase/alanine dehydrogenase-like protein (mu-crystallin family)